MRGKKDNLKPMWDKMIKQVDLGEPNSLFDQFFWDVRSENASHT